MIRKLKRKKIREEGEKSLTTQQEANEAEEGNPFDIPGKYAHVIKLMWLMGFYAPLIPIIYPAP